MEINEQKHYSLIIAIVNKGYTDIVMEAAKSKGARGGTTFNARGTGNKDLGEFFGIAIEQSKEIAFILVDEKIKDDVLLAIYKDAGLESKGQGIAFSVNVSDVIGLTPIDVNKLDNFEKKNI